jgi:hypothetical protein
MKIIELFESERNDHIVSKILPPEIGGGRIDIYYHMNSLGKIDQYSYSSYVNI